MTAVGNSLYSQFQEEGAQGATRASSRAGREAEEGSTVGESLLVVSPGRRGEAGRAGSGPASLSNSSGSGLRGCPGCLVRGGLEQGDSECAKRESPVQEGSLCGLWVGWSALETCAPG